MTEDVEETVLIVTEKLTTILIDMAPVKCIQTQAKYAPWLSKETKEKIKARNKAQKIASESNLKEDWDEFKRKRNEITKILKSEKRAWQANKIKTFGSDTSSIWKNIKNWLGWTAGGPPSKLIENDSVFNKPSDIARIMKSTHSLQLSDSCICCKGIYFLHALPFGVHQVFPAKRIVCRIARKDV